MTRALIAAALLAALARPATADLPPGRMAVMGGLRSFQGDAGDDYTTNFVYGPEGGYQPGRFGVHGTLLLGYFDTASEKAITSRTLIVQMSFALRGTVSFGPETPLYASAQAGLDIFRSGEPMPVEDGERSYIGPGVGAGLEIEIPPVVLSLWARYSVMVTDVQGLNFLFSIGTGG